MNRYQQIDTVFAALGEDDFSLAKPVLMNSVSKLKKPVSTSVTNQSFRPKTLPVTTVVESNNDERNSSFLCPILATIFLSLAILCGYYALPTIDSVAVPSGTTQIEKRYVTKNIEEIQVGDEVYAFDTDTGNITHRKVTSVLEHSSDHLRYLEIHDGTGRTQIFETTDVHPFWVITDTPDLSRAAEENVEDNGIIFYHENIESNINGFYVAAKNLLIGDRFIAPDGTVSSLKNSWRIEYPDGISVYNFEVEGEHNYFVIANYEAFLNGEKPILAHNARKCGNETETVQRWMSQAELLATRVTGLLRGGRDGTHYVTDSANSSAQRARLRTALPQTPEARVTMEVPKDVFSSPTKVKPANGMPGGGMERTSRGKIKVTITNVDGSP